MIWREYPVKLGTITASLDGSGLLEATGIHHSFDPASFFVYWSRTQSGKNIMKQIPAPPSLSADIVPPIDSTIVFTIDSPKPAPRWTNGI